MFNLGHGISLVLGGERKQWELLALAFVPHVVLPSSKRVPVQSHGDNKEV